MERSQTADSVQSARYVSTINPCFANVSFYLPLFHYIFLNYVYIFCDFSFVTARGLTEGGRGRKNGVK